MYVIPIYSSLFLKSHFLGPGERIARMELAVLLGTTLHQFRIELSDANVPLKSSAKLLLSPSDDITATVRFIPRR